MILTSMFFKEMYDGLLVDSRKVQIRIGKTYPKVVKMFRKSLSFPVSYIDEYKIPSTNNQYIIYYYATSTIEGQKPRYEPFCVVFHENQRYIIMGMLMGYNHTPQSKMVMLPQIHVYTSHFFQRYNERYLQKENLLANEIAGMFFVRNPRIMPIRLNEAINRKFKEHGSHNNQGMRVNDGFCFTQTAIEGQESEDGVRENDRVDAMAIIYTTFINESGLTETQRTAINKGHFETWVRCLEDLEKLVLIP